MRKFIVSAASALCLAAFASTPSMAAETSVTVSYSDLDLTSTQGVETLEARIAAAVKSVCARPDFIRDLKAMSAWERCKAGAETRARAQLETTVQLARL